MDFKGEFFFFFFFFNTGIKKKKAFGATCQTSQNQFAFQHAYTVESRRFVTVYVLRHCTHSRFSKHC